jgi:hypothetical protein
MVLETLLSPDVIKENIAKEAGKALRELNAQIVNERQIVVKAKVDKTTTYDATDDFSKSREKLDTEPTPEEIKKANDVVAEITKLTDNDAINKYIKEHSSEWNETIINLMISKITEKENDYLNKSVQWADEESSIVGANPDMPEKSATIRKAKATREKHYFYAKTNTMRAIIAKLKSIINKRTQQASLENARAQGVVTNYKEIPANSKLDTIIKKLQITFKEDEDGLIGVYVNGKYTNFDIYDPDYDESYDLMTGENIAFIIEIMGKTGKKYLAKFQLENGEVIKYGAYEGKQLHKISSFKIAPKEEVSYTKG